MHSSVAYPVSVTIHGDQGAGKKTLASALHKHIYIRNQDKVAFIFDAQIVAKPPSNLTSVSFVLVDASRPDQISDKTMALARQSSASTCILLTKPDLIAVDGSEEYFSYLCQMHWLPCEFVCDCFAVNITTEEGIRKVMDYAANSHDPLPKSLSWKVLLQRSCSLFLDFVATLFSLPTSRPAIDVNAELAMVQTQDDVERLANDTMTAAWNRELKHRLQIEHSWGSPRVHHITPSLVAKESGPFERASMEFVRRHTTIPIPNFYHHHLPSLLMDFIDGEMLYECWDMQTWFMQFRIACTLRTYVKQLRMLKRPNAGHLHDGYVSGIFFSEGDYGPFDSIVSFRRFCTHVAYLGWETLAGRDISLNERPEPLPNTDFDWTPTFVHGDLNMTNIILDKGGRLWVIDWGNAGFYPPCIESLAMRHSNELILKNRIPSSWSRYRQFIAGATSMHEEQFWDNVYLGFIHRFSGTSRR
ncbi:hypothetical protein DENSPDRAFT_825497 [Dentipellis sp. KUC8613]|nr:hypothetical protein DENSPDRAFT_825497 [Dentipellis sp. KUC8613]